MKRKFEKDLLYSTPVKEPSSNSPTSDLDSFEILSLAKEARCWRKGYGNSFRSTLSEDKASENYIFTDKLRRKLKLEDAKGLHLYFCLEKLEKKHLFKNPKKEYALHMNYSCDGFGGTCKGNLIKKLYFEVKDKLESK